MHVTGAPGLRGRHLLVAVGLTLTALTSACASGSSGTAAAQPTASSPQPKASSQPSQALPVTVHDADGGTTTVTNTSRIVSLNGNITEVVYALGLGKDVVADDISATYPPAAAKAPKIGYQGELTAEPILAKQPTVVIGDTTAAPASAIAQVRSAGIPVVILPSYQGYAGALQKITAVAQALGVPATGQKVRAQVSASITAAERKAATYSCHPRIMLLYLRGTSVELAAGAGAGYTSIFTAVGAVDAGAQSGLSGFAPITPEALVKAAPQILIVTTTGLASIGGLNALLKIPGVAQTPAGRDKDVLAFEDDFLLNNSTRVGQLMQQLAVDLHRGCPATS
jgi:iron complex transport system substrate-binding protein